MRSRIYVPAAFDFVVYAIAMIAVLLASPICLLADGTRATSDKPNIVFVFADDLGINDLHCYGRRDHNTPNIDLLATQGMRFTCAYTAQPICSPSRAALMTGLCPARLHLTNYLPGRPDAPAQRLLQPRIEGQLPLEETTIAEVLKRAGYATGLFGKWHLGGNGFGPLEQGFDVAFMPPGTTPPKPETGGKGEYIITGAAEEFIEEHRNQPFYCYVAHNCPHIPLSAIPELVKKNHDAFNPTYAAMIETLDNSVGRLMAKIESLGLADRTIFIFTSDNGGLHVLESPDCPATHNTPYRAGKGYVYEGGLREPLVVRWPSVIKRATTCDTPVVLTDLVPTLLEAAGVDVAKDMGPLDGVSITPLIKGESLPPRPLYWHFPNYTNQGGLPAGAIRDGDWKLIEQYEDNRLELYNLANDPSESHNLATTDAVRASHLLNKLRSWRTSVGAQMGTPNPSFDAALHKRLYVDQDPSKLTPGSAAADTRPAWKDWRAAMNAAVKDQTPSVTPATGDIRLHAKDARIHGQTLRYEPQPNKNVLGYWTNPSDWADWGFTAPAAGTYEVEIQQGCGTTSGGASVNVKIDDQALNFTVQETGHFQKMILRAIGAVKLAEGHHTVSVQPQSKPGVAVMDLRRIVLRPVR